MKLTKTETEILIDIALGMTTKEIAEKRGKNKAFYRQIAVAIDDRRLLI